VRVTDLAARAERALTAATVFVAAVFAFRQLDDFDTWWHLAAGRWIVEHGRVPATDTLSYTVPDHAWTNLQWLYDVAMYLLYRVGGANLLVIAATVAFTVAIWLLMRNVRLFVGPVVACIIGLWAIAIAQERFLIRPEMVSFILLELVLWLLLTARRDAGRRLWLLPLVMVLWVNCHSLFIIGLTAIGCAVGGVLLAHVGYLPRGWRERSALDAAGTRRLLTSAAASVVALVLNPFFVQGALFPFKLLSRINGSNTVFRAIGEFRRPFSGYFTTFSIGAYQTFFFASVTVVAVGWVIAAVRRAPDRCVDGGEPSLDFGSVAFFVALAYLSLMARRNMGVFVMGAAPAVAAALSVLVPRGREGVGRLLRGTGLALAPALLAGCLAVCVFVATNGYYQWNNVTHAFGLGVYETNFPIRAAEFSREVGLPANLYNDMTAGGYLTWKSPVDGGVFIDGRLEVYDTKFFSDYLGALSNPAAWQAQVDRYGVGTVILFHRWGNRHYLIRNLMRDRRWAVVYHDEVAIVFVRTAGNEQVVAKARAAFPAWFEKTKARLEAPVPRWQAPVERATALESYGALLFTIGDPETGTRMYERLLALDIPDDTRANADFRIGYYLASKGKLDEARLHLERAQALKPNDGRIRELLRRIDALRG
jgi:hypothetical protein